MPLQLDLSQNYLLPANSQAVTYYRKTAQGAFAPGVTVTFAKKRAVTKNDLSDDLALTAEDTVWHLWAARLTGLGSPPATVVPKKGDQIEESLDVGWVIKTVEVQSYATRYRCVCTGRQGRSPGA